MKIGIDIDNVIADSHPAYLEQYTSRFGDKVKLDSVVDFYHIEDHIAAEREEVLDFLNSHLHTDAFQITINPVANASLHIQSWLDRGLEIIYISARPESIRAVTMAWLMKHGFWRESKTTLFLFDESKRYSDIAYKTGIVNQEGVSLVVEDKKDIAEAMPVQTFLFDRPWNKGDTISHITRVYSWDDLDAKILPFLS